VPVTYLGEILMGFKKKTILKFGTKPGTNQIFNR